MGSEDAIEKPPELLEALWRVWAAAVDVATDEPVPVLSAAAVEVVSCVCPAEVEVSLVVVVVVVVVAAGVAVDVEAELSAAVVEDVVVVVVVEGVVVAVVVVEGVVVVVAAVVEGVVVAAVEVVAAAAVPVAADAAVAVPVPPAAPCAAEAPDDGLGVRPEEGRFVKACPGFTWTKSRVIFLELSLWFAEFTKEAASEVTVLTRIIFFGRSGRVDAYCSAKLMADPILFPFSTGYCRRMRPIIVSTSPTSEIRRATSRRGFPEKVIRWKVSPTRRNSLRNWPVM
jgi:hypothetical protein